MNHKIIRLEAENVKRLQAVTITPTGALVVIGGRNAQGKSSCLDAIEYTLGGDPKATVPVRRGQERARIIVDLGDIVVKRTFTAAGGTALVVANADGIKQASPQAILDKLTGRLTFDPLAFARQKPEEQSKTLRALVGLDFTDKDQEREKLYNQRTVVNRDAKALEGQMAGMKSFSDAPAEEISGATILEEQRAATDKNKANESVRRGVTIIGLEVERAVASLETRQEAIKETEEKIAQLQKLLREQQAGAVKLSEALEFVRRQETEAKKATASLQDVDLAPFAAKLEALEGQNNQVRQNARRAEIVKRYKAKCQESEALTAKITEIDSFKRRGVTEAKYPIDGLAFDAAGGVELNGLPLDQASESEKLRVSVAIGLALNPKLRVLLIRDGSLLDSQALEEVANMAAAADAQIWLERVSEDGQTSVVIEDGLVKNQDEEQAEVKTDSLNQEGAGH